MQIRNKFWHIFLLLLLFSFISGCKASSNTNDFTCKLGYIRYMDGCCLDTNQNNICDNKEPMEKSELPSFVTSLCQIIEQDQQELGRSDALFKCVDKKNNILYGKFPSTPGRGTGETYYDSGGYVVMIYTWSDAPDQQLYDGTSSYSSCLIGGKMIAACPPVECEQEPICGQKG